MVFIKGIAIAGGIQRIIGEFGKQGYNKIIDQLEEADKKIFQDGILSSIWYPLTSFVKFIEKEMQLYYNGNKTKLLTNSKKVVDNQLRGVYRLFIKFGSPEFVVKKIGLVHKSYFKGVDLEVMFLDHGKYVGRYIGFEKQHSIFEYSIIAFYKKALEISGARNVKAEFTAPMAAGLDYSEITVSWANT